MNAPKVHLIPMQTGTANFDVIAEIDSVGDTWAAWQMAKSYTWKIDAMINQITSALFRTVREKYAEANGIQVLSDVTAMLAESTAAAQAFHDAGLSSDGPVTNLVQLTMLRDEAYALEKEMCFYANPEISNPETERIDEITGVVYKPLFAQIPLNELFLAFVPKTPSAAARVRYETDVIGMAKTYYSDEAEREAFVAEEMAKYDAREQSECKVFNDGLARNAPIKQLILEEAMKLPVDPIESTYELATPVLQEILRHLNSQVAKIKTWNDQRSRIPQINKAMATAELSKFAKNCELSLRTARFNEGAPFTPPVRKPFRQIA